MIRLVRFMLGAIALVALCGVGTHAQGAGAGQKPPDTKAKPEAQAQAKDTQAKPAEARAPELTAEQKAFNAIAEEKDAQKRNDLYEKFIADYPKSGMLVSLARSEIQRSTLATLKASSHQVPRYREEGDRQRKVGHEPDAALLDLLAIRW